MRIGSNDSVLSAWLWGILHHRPKPGGFLEQLAATAFNADVENYEILRPALIIMKEKYPKYNWLPDGWIPTA